MVRIWKAYLSTRVGRFELLLTISTLGLMLNLFSKFVQMVENRQGVVLNDPVLNLFQPIDTTWLIFSLIYSAIIVAIYHLLSRPKDLLFGLQAYTLMITVRILTMWVTPLDPPPTMLILKDPFIELFGPGKTLTRDLFFSGHTSTMFLLGLVAKSPRVSIAFYVLTLVVGALVLAQHVHYTIDVFTAPFMAYACYRLAGWDFSKLWRKNRK